MTPRRPWRVPIGFALALCTALLLTPSKAFATPTAQIIMAKSNDTGGSAAAGQTVTYTITVTDNGPNGAPQTVIHDTLDSHLININANATTPSQCTVVGQLVSCTLQGLGSSGDVNQIQITAEVDPSTPVDTVITNCADWESGNYNLGANSVTHACDGDGFTVIAEANLAITKTQTSPDPGTVTTVDGATDITYHIVATNNGPSTAANVSVGDSFTLGSATFVSIDNVTPTPDFSCNAALPVSCTIASLDSGSSVSFDLTVTAPNDGTTSITNTATVGSDTFDPDTSDNTSSVTTAICQSVDLAITKDAQDQTEAHDPITTIQGGSNFRYHIVATNNDPSVAATNVVITDVLPAGVTYVSDDSGCDTSALPTVTCSTSSVAAAGGTFTVNIVVTAVNSGNICNSASVAADQCDRTPSDNTSADSCVDVATNNTPVGLEADREGCGTDADCPSLVSDLNRVFEPNETARVDPAWKNTLDNDDPDVTGTASNLTGPGFGTDATYSIDDPTADYGPIAAGATSDCNTATNDCYAFTITQTDPNVRPHNADHPRHWDATFHEALLPGGETFDWQLHIGDSFPDVPRSNIFYRYVETIFHNHITIGCQSGNIFCPGDPATRQEMSAFIARSILLKDENVPATDGSTYDCTASGPIAGQFVDVPKTNGFCKYANYLKSINVTLGCFDTTHFCPLNDVLRSDMAVFIARAYVYKASLTPGPATTDPDGDVPQWKQSADLSREYNCTNSDQIDPDTTNVIPANTKPLSDVPTNASFCKHVGFLFVTTIKGDPTKYIIDGTTGNSSGQFLPGHLIRRDETAKILANAFGDLPLYGPLVF